jgi:6-phosphofructokinase 1
MTAKSRIRRVGILFSGGPAPAANAVISAATMSFLNEGIEVYGFLDGYHHLARCSSGSPLVEGRHYLNLTIDKVSHIRNRKPILLRTSRANPGRPIKTLNDLTDPERNGGLMATYRALESLEIDALVSIGGDDTLKTGNFIYRLQETTPGLRPVSVVHLPKTIDNDYYGIDWTFGFTSAVNFAAGEIRNLSADAKSTSAWYILEIMGRKAGWLTYASGIAGEATRMISVEDFEGTFDLKLYADQLTDLMKARAEDGRDYGIVCIAEGLADRLPEELRPKDMDAHGNIVLGKAQVGTLLAEMTEKRYEEKTGRKVKVRSKQIGYETRCTSPVAFDILLGCQLGVGASRALLEEGLSGVMVSVEDQLQIKYVPFDELIDAESLKTRVRLIEKESDFYQLARALEYHTVLGCKERKKKEGGQP